MKHKKRTEKAMKKAAKQYFKEYMMGKDIDTILYETFQVLTVILGKTLGQTQVFWVCLDSIKSNKAYFETLDAGKKQRLEDSLEILMEVCDNLDEILLPFVESLYGDDEQLKQ